MNRAAAAEGDQGQSARVDAALDRDRTQRPDHVGVGQLADALGGALGGQAERGRDLALDRGAGEIGLEPKRATGEAGRVEQAEGDVGIGDRGQGAALAVAGGSGLGAGGARPDLEQAALVDRQRSSPPRRRPRRCRSPAP